MKNHLFAIDSRITSLFDLSDDMFSIISTDGQLLQLNAAWKNATGYDAAELQSKDLLTLFHPEAEDLAREKLLNRPKSSDAKISFEASLKCKNGSYKWFIWKASFDLSSACIFIFSKEISDKTPANSSTVPECPLYEKQSREKEIQLLAFIEDAPFAIAMLDNEMKYIHASNLWKKEYLKGVNFFIGESYYKFSPEPALRRFYQRALVGETVKDEQFEYVRKDGGKEWFSIEARPWYISENVIGGIMIVKEDVTFRKIAHAAVTEKSQMLNGILRNIPVIIFRINEENIFTQFIGSGLRALGLSDYDVVGKNVYELFPALKDNIDKTFEGGKNVFVTSGRHDGKEWHFENHTFPDNVNNSGIVGFSFDTTEKVLKEKELEKAREQAVLADKYKSKFLANMSHEIRTPLNAIIGFAEVFERANLNPEQHEYLQNITSSGNLLLKLIGDILDLSKIEEGKMNLENESFNIREILSSDLLPYKYHAGKKGLSFSIEFDDTIPPYVFGDSNKIKQVIINLIGNSLKFTKSGGIKITVSMGREILDNGKKSIRFAVTDTGIGILPDQQHKIFETFTQADDSVEKEYGGSGLGLSIVKQIVNLMGGEINITSPVLSEGPQPGSCFWFVIQMEVDAARKLPDEIPTKEVAGTFSEPIKILVAEDNPMNSALANIILTRMGCQVSFAENGEEAVEMFFSNDYDMVLMDVQMPLMNGFQATSMIRKQTNKKVPIIGLTANVYKDDVERCLSSGMDDYLGKPYTELQMYKMVKKWRPKKVNSYNGKKYVNLQFLEKSGSGNKNFLKEMIAVFLLQNDEFFRTGAAALKGKDCIGLKQAAHKIKSCYKMMGIDEGADLLQKIERMKDAIEWHHMAGLFKSIQLLSEKVVDELTTEEAV